MPTTAKDMSKAVLARAAGALAPNARFENCVFVLSHMRSVSTALSNVVCSHPDVCGYGETHVKYADAKTPGGLWVNLAVRHSSGRPRGRLFDKILHNDLDGQPDSAFFAAKAIFLLRAPAPAIASIRSLARRNGLADWESADAAADYYVDRVNTLSEHWLRFAPENRMGLLTEDMLSSPDSSLSKISGLLGISPPLQNLYQAAKSGTRHGVGDPDVAMVKTRITPVPTSVDIGPVHGVDQVKSDACLAAYSKLSDLFKADADQEHFRV